MRLAGICAFLIVLLMTPSCADLVPLTGGPRDVVAPKPLDVSPENGSTGIYPNKVVLVFDEYVTIKDPGTSITMSPEVGPLTSELNKKTLTVSWQQPLKEETTYILNLNGTVRDLNEGNDSIMQMVFSTGKFIDSLSHHGRVTSAYSGEMLQNVTVCLYHPDSVPYTNKPSYFTRTDKGGNYTFSYLKNGEYTLFAFQDQNKNGSADATENIAFREERIQTTDTTAVALRVFKPKKTREKLNVVVEQPGTALLSGLNFDSIPASVNGEEVVVMKRYQHDSIRIALPATAEKNRYIYAAGKDTLVKLLAPEDRNARFAVKLQSNKQWKQGDTLFFSSNEKYRSIDTTAMELFTSTNRPVAFKAGLTESQLFIIPNTTDNFTVKFNARALAGAANSNDTIRFNFETFIPEKCGTIALDVSEFGKEWVFELVNNVNTENGTVVGRYNGNGGKLQFTQLIPGQYSIRCFKDENGNGKWDSGNYAESLQPELMLRFPVKQKVRANWDIEEKITPN